MPVPQFCNCLVNTKHDGFGKRLCPSAKINYTVSCNISLYHDTKEVNNDAPKTCIIASLFCIVRSEFFCV